MRKILLVTLSVMFLLCTALLVACGGHVCKWDSQIYYDKTRHYQVCTDPECAEINVLQEHDWQSSLSYDGTKHFLKCTDPNCPKTTGVSNHELSFSFDDSVKPYSATKSCICGYSSPIDYTTVTPQNAQHTLDNLTDSTVVMLTIGNYPKLVVSSKSDLIIYSGEHVTVELLLIEGNCKNIYIYDTVFDLEGDTNTHGKAGIKIEGDGGSSYSRVDGLTIKNCTFKHNAGILTDSHVTVRESNVLIQNCKFYNIDRCSRNGWRTAIVLMSVDNVTIEGCEFDAVQRSAIDVALEKKTSSVTIKNNSFKRIGGRVLVIAIYEENTMEVSGNTFYKEISSTNSNVNLKQTTGVYIYGSVAKLTIGANIWEVMPEKTDKYFLNLDIDMSEQTLLGAN